MHDLRVTKMESRIDAPKGGQKVAMSPLNPQCLERGGKHHANDLRECPK
jgi:hypothetical protein